MFLKAKSGIVSHLTMRRQSREAALSTHTHIHNKAENTRTAPLTSSAESLRPDDSSSTYETFLL